MKRLRWFALAVTIVFGVFILEAPHALTQPGGIALPPGIYIYSSSLTPVATAAAIGTTQQTFTYTGLTTSDMVFIMTAPVPTSLCPAVSARVSAANTLQIDFTTLTAAACTPAPGVYYVAAIR